MRLFFALGAGVFVYAITRSWVFVAIVIYVVLTMKLSNEEKENLEELVLEERMTEYEESFLGESKDDSFAMQEGEEDEEGITAFQQNYFLLLATLFSLSRSSSSPEFQRAKQVFLLMGFSERAVMILWDFLHSLPGDSFELSDLWKPLEVYTEDERTFLLEGIYRLALIDGELDWEFKDSLRDVLVELDIQKNRYVAKFIYGRSLLQNDFSPKTDYSMNEIRLTLGLSKGASIEEIKARLEKLKNFYRKVNLPRLAAELSLLKRYAEDDLAHLEEALERHLEDNKVPLKSEQIRHEKPSMKEQSLVISEESVTFSLSSKESEEALRLLLSDASSVDSSQRRAPLKEEKETKPLDIVQPVPVSPYGLHTTETIDFYDSSKVLEKKRAIEMKPTKELHRLSSRKAFELDEVVSSKGGVEEESTSLLNELEEEKEETLSHDELETLLTDWRDSQDLSSLLTTKKSFQELWETSEEQDLAVEEKSFSSSAKKERVKVEGISQGERLEELVEGLAEVDPLLRKKAVEELSSMGPEVIEQLLPHLDSYIYRDGFKELFRSWGEAGLSALKKAIEYSDKFSSDWLLDLAEEWGMSAAQVIYIPQIKENADPLMQYKIRQKLRTLGFEEAEIDALKV